MADPDTRGRLALRDTNVTLRRIRDLGRARAAHPGTRPVHLAVSSDGDTNTHHELTARAAPRALQARIEPLDDALAWNL
ncbi:hypothetical protein ACFZBU_41925 [Embleya sp. NPDC008237]|uniref:hypothetical protein n=1 Tax=Embleya sp. NPDC008237 TaxID=3363978 RepID=UPI0036E272DB